MFVAAGARQQLLEQRRQQFTERHVEPMIAEASRLGIDTDELVELVRKTSTLEEGVRL
jgi:DNA-binding transcriptional regulator YhcF (GntR family)